MTKYQRADSKIYRVAEMSHKESTLTGLSEARKAVVYYLIHQNP